MRKRILVIFGTRPEAIKMAPVVKELKKYPQNFKTIICTTAQHREMLDEVLSLFGIRTDYDLNIMEDNQSPFEVTAKGLFGIRKVLKEENPDIMLVQGDTTSTFTASLAAFYLKIPIGHIEAGLRTNDRYKPFPEEINRRLTSHLANFHFAPTQRAKQHLISEGIPRETVFLTGNTVIDALLYMSKKIKKMKAFDRYFSFLNLKSNKLILVTAHRRENFGEPLKNICLALKKIVERNKNVRVVYPVHPNPNVKETVNKILGKIARVELIAPVDYAAFIYLMNKSYFILTDSGGIQEEASSLGKPILVMREKTERQEVIEAGLARLVGTNTNKIIHNAEILLNNGGAYRKMAKVTNPFGDGRAAQRIVHILKSKI
jgi:UDP-N-acetylglucosamine 2-epimerase (non-hydrolysing)